MHRVIFQCDKLFEGFLSAVFLAYQEKIVPYVTSESRLQNNFGDEVRKVLTDMEAARRVESGIVREIGDDGLYDVRCAYSCGDDRRENMIYQYLRLVFKHGARALTMYNQPEVIDFNRLVSLTRSETHRMLGFLRFIEMQNGVFYAPLSTDNDIIEYVVPHFARRLNNQKFVIHDAKRCKLAIYDGNSYTVGHVEGKADIFVGEREIAFTALWKKYFDTVTIEERTNPRLQRAFLPKKYRKILPEFAE